MSALSLAVYLARAGVGSRRRCDELVKAGAVTVNGEVVTFPRHQTSEDDVVEVEGLVVRPRELRYLLVSKPRGVASTRSDPHAERVLVDLVPEGRLLFPVGRLDAETTGLIILTNDGPLANRLMHPSYGVPKTYLVRVRGRVSKRALSLFRSGIELEEGLTAPAEARLVKQSAKTALVEVVLHEGRKRQVRRMFEALGLPVEELHRRRYGPLTDKNLNVGDYRELTRDEVDALRRAGERVGEAIGNEPEEHPVTMATGQALAAAEGGSTGPEAAGETERSAPGSESFTEARGHGRAGSTLERQSERESAVAEEPEGPPVDEGESAAS